MSVAEPAPNPDIFVGVLTAMNIMSASAIVFDVAVVKMRFGRRAGIVMSSCLSEVAGEEQRLSWPSNDTGEDEALLVEILQAFKPSLATRTTLPRPGSLIGRCVEFHRLIRKSSRSTTVTLREGFLRAITAAVGAPDSVQTLEKSIRLSSLQPPEIA